MSSAVEAYDAVMKSLVCEGKGYDSYHFQGEPLFPGKDLQCFRHVTRFIQCRRSGTENPFKTAHT